VAFADTLLSQMKGMLLPILLWTVLPLIPFIIAEQLRPVGQAPRLRDYTMNILIGISTAYLSLPAGIAAGSLSAQLRGWLPWTPLSFTFASVGRVPFVGPALEVLAMIFIPLVLHDFWFYWSHRLEHAVPALWAFHRIHHSDPRMNAATFGRDHFLQTIWRTFFSIFTLGLIVDLHLSEAGKAALYSNLFLIGLSMFYHSAIRVRVPGFNRLLVTPQVHRIHHSTDPAHYNKNFADALPIFDILFGTFHSPGREEFPATGLRDFPAPRSLWSAQWGPVAALWNMIRPRLASR
jgi:sterol desaturase/sphingolipid hydroxylase (fatty acid hydroxylase superfamily)